jgi:hypothetical protein
VGVGRRRASVAASGGTRGGPVNGGVGVDCWQTSECWSFTRTYGGYQSGWSAVNTGGKLQQRAAAAMARGGSGWHTGKGQGLKYAALRCSG